MKGFRAEPGERTASARSTPPARSLDRYSAPPTWARTSPLALSMATMAMESFGPSRATLSRASASSPACSRASKA